MDTGTRYCDCSAAVPAKNKKKKKSILYRVRNDNRSMRQVWRARVVKKGLSYDS